MEQIRSQFGEAAWQSFYRMVFLGDTAAEIGRDLGMAEKAVRQAKYRVAKKLQQTLGGIKGVETEK